MSKRIFFSSDFHYHHRNIVRGISSWEDKSECRNYGTLEQHDDAIVNSINSTVKEDDILYFLGDWAFGGPEEVINLRRRLNVKTIHWITGNHDREAIMRPVFFSNFFTTISPYKEIKIGEQLICMFHYPARVWNRANRGSWFLHGHCHGTAKPYAQPHKNIISYAFGKEEPLYKTMDVGIDTHPRFVPWSFEQIEDIMKNRISLTGIDHHKSRI